MCGAASVAAGIAGIRRATYKHSLKPDTAPLFQMRVEVLVSALK